MGMLTPDNLTRRGETMGSRNSILAVGGVALLTALQVAWADTEQVVFSDYQTQKPVRCASHTTLRPPGPDPLQGLAANGAFRTARPDGVWPQTLPGFTVHMFADTHLDTPRELRTAPNGDIFLADSGKGQVRVYRGVDTHGRARQTSVFAKGLNRLYGMALYPPGPDPAWLYVSTPTDVYRLPYHKGDSAATGDKQHLITLPGNGQGHWTRDLAFSKDGRKLYVAVGSQSDVIDTDAYRGRGWSSPHSRVQSGRHRATCLRLRDRNPGGGLAVHPKSGELWCSVNERRHAGRQPGARLHHPRPGGGSRLAFYYMGADPDPRVKGKHPELAAQTLVPDVLIQPHNASLQLTFYQGTQFPATYQGDIFSSQHGSWNRSERTGYEVIRIPMHGKTRATGEYEDFLTGFVLPDGRVWGRPVGITVASDGALLVSDGMATAFGE